jgi:CHAD domain-containing protein
MSFRLTLTRAAGNQVRRVACEQVECALQALGDADASKGVHTARKRLKMLRSTVRLLRKPLGNARQRQELDYLREAGRRLSAARDADVLIGALDDLRHHDRTAGVPMLVTLRRRLARERVAQHRALPDHADVARATLQAARERIDRWPLRSLTADHLVEAFARGYARGRRACRVVLADPTDDHLHDWRKRAKDLWYHLRLLREAWPAVTGAWGEEAHRLTDLLGDDHDLSMLIQTLSRRPERRAAASGASVVRAAILRRREMLQDEARLLGLRLYAEKPGAFERRVSVYVSALRHASRGSGRHRLTRAA